MPANPRDGTQKSRSPGTNLVSVPHRAVQLEGLLAEDVSSSQQTSDKIREDQLLSSLVNSLDEETALSPAENVELGAEDIYEVFVGACADGISVSALCRRSEDAPCESSAPYHLRTKFDLETLEQIGNTLLQKDVFDVLP